MPISAVNGGNHTVLSPDMHSLGQSLSSVRRSPEGHPPETHDFVLQTSLEPTIPPR